MFLVDAETWTAVPMHLIVDSFSRAPMVLLPEKSFMGLDVTGHRPVFEIPEMQVQADDVTGALASDTPGSLSPETPTEPGDQPREDSLK